MAYKYKKYTFPYSIEHEIKFKGKYGGKGEKRAPRVKATPEQIAKQNQRNREILVRRKIKENFDLGDHWTTLKLPKGMRITAEELNGLFRKFCTNLRGRYSRRGEVLKWIARMEIGKQGGAHIHVLINRIRDSDKLITEVWRRLVEKSSVNFRPMDDLGPDALGYYITKQPDEEVEGQLSLFPEEDRKQFVRYRCSRNLKEPEPEIHAYKRRTVRKLIIEGLTATPGYYIVKESIYMGTNPFTGYSYISYTENRILSGRARGGGT